MTAKKDEIAVEMSNVDLDNHSPIGLSSPVNDDEDHIDGNHKSSETTKLSKTENDSKLELFEMDSLVDALGVKSMAGQHEPLSPREGENESNTKYTDKNIQKNGTLLGVFVPCVQNIMGIIFYIRFSWIIGIAGVGQSLLIIFLTCSCTFLTGLSLSAIATNGAMKGGGPYYLISRALGPEVGVSIGLCFFLGNAVAGALYILGCVETLLNAIPGMGIFGVNHTVFALSPSDVSSPSSTSTQIIKSTDEHDMQVYGIIIAITLCLIVFAGVKAVARIGPLFLIPALIAVICIFIGVLSSPRAKLPEGITGIKWSTLTDNWKSSYQNTNQAGIPDPNGKLKWSFESLCGLFFPAVTGIMAGSNRSASLKDTQRSIPRGTLSAIGVTTSIYIVAVFLFGSVATREVLLTDRLFTATIAWPYPGVVSIGIILSTLGAALQSLMGAPRLLSAIANDDILPILNIFKVNDDKEPHLATAFTLLICCGCVVIGNLDYITPVITMFFLLCYCGVNLSCFLLDLLDAPSWRPRFKLHHWFLSLLGAALCVVIMFLISWYFTLVSIALATFIYYYVTLVGKGGNWGDGIKSAYFQLALRSLRSLGADAVHPKNWYPIPLIFCRPWKILPSDVPCHPKLAEFANCMKKKGRGMSIFASVYEGDYSLENMDIVKRMRKQLNSYIEYKECEGVAEVIASASMAEGFRSMVQSMGLGNLKPNIICMRYPEVWDDDVNSTVPDTFTSIIKDCNVAKKACVIVKGLDLWPSETEKQYGNIDLYWIVRDGGIMLLLSQLLLSKSTFESCKIRVICIAEEDDSAEGLKKDVKQFLYDLRMAAEVVVVTMKGWEDFVNDVEDPEAELSRHVAMESFSDARKRIAVHFETEENSVKSLDLNENKVNKFLYTSIKLNSIIMRYSRSSSVVFLSLPPPPSDHPSYCYMEYVDLLVKDIPRLLLVRGNRRDVVTIFS